jgi:hypothetical protein
MADTTSSTSNQGRPIDRSGDQSFAWSDKQSQETGGAFMKQEREDNVIFMSREEWGGWTPLLRKLRRIGLHEQARRLEVAVKGFGHPVEEVAAGNVGPST